MESRPSLRLASVSVILLVVYGVIGVQSCSPYSNGGGKFGKEAKTDYSYLDHLDAAKYPTLSSKIRHVLDEHYKKGHSHGGWHPEVEAPVHHAHHGGHGGYGLHHYSHSQHHGPSHHGWGGGHGHPGFEYGASSLPQEAPEPELPAGHPAAILENHPHMKPGPPEGPIGDEESGFRFPSY